MYAFGENEKIDEKLSFIRDCFLEKPDEYDDYIDDCCYEDKSGDCCCDKTKEEIENDIEVYQECMRNEEERLAEEMENQLIANYDFERGDVKY